MRITSKKIFLLALVPLVVVTITGMNATEPDDFDTWLEQDDIAVERALAVNEGDLEFLIAPPENKIPHYLKNELNIRNSSLKDGWVDLVQCHENLDSVSAAQILYHDRRTRKLEVLSKENVKSAWVEDNTVQLENIGKNAKVCVGAQVKALYSNYDGSFSMRNGPFLRKFLDGYYPMRVTMDVSLPAEKLRYEAILPQEQAGFKVMHNDNNMLIDALFVGELSIEIYFTETTTAIN